MGDVDSKGKGGSWSSDAAPKSSRHPAPSQPPPEAPPVFRRLKKRLYEKEALKKEIEAIKEGMVKQLQQTSLTSEATPMPRLAPQQEDTSDVSLAQEDEDGPLQRLPPKGDPVRKYRVKNWHKRRKEKRDTQCKECSFEHKVGEECPRYYCMENRRRKQPLNSEGKPLPLYPDTFCTPSLGPKGGPVQLCLTGDTPHMALTTHLTLPDGQPCSFITVVAFRYTLHDFIFKSHTNTWAAVSQAALVYEFEKLGFEDEAIFNVYNRLHEMSWDALEFEMEDAKEALEEPYLEMDEVEEYEQLFEIPMVDATPAYNLVIIACCGGRVKVAGQLSNNEVIMVGDHQLHGPGKAKDVMCYGKPHARVTIREGLVSSRDYFMAVPKDIPSETIEAIAREDDVRAMARKLLKHLPGPRPGAWVARFKL